MERKRLVLPKHGSDETAAEIDVPFKLDLDDGDRIIATITESGAVEIRAIDPDKGTDLGSVVIEGFTPKEAQAIAKSSWGQFWSWVKSTFFAVKDAITDALTFDGGPYLGSCRPDAGIKVTHVDGIAITEFTLGIKCIQ